MTASEEERLLSEAPIIPHIAPLDTVNIQKAPRENVQTLMRLFYERQESSQELVAEFNEGY